MSEKSPTLAELLESAIEGYLDDLRVALPGRIETYDASTRRATVQPLPMDGHYPESGSRHTTKIPVLTDVPVAMWGSGSVRIKVTPRPRDPCWLLVSSSSIASMKASGRAEAVYDPGDRRHHLADAIAVPWVVVGSGVESEPLINFTPTAVQLGDDEATEAAIKGTTLKAAGDNLNAAMQVFFAPPPAGPFANFVSAAAGLPGMATTAGLLGTAIGVLFTALQAYQAAVANVLSTKVKVS